MAARHHDAPWAKHERRGSHPRPLRRGRLAFSRGRLRAGRCAAAGEGPRRGGRDDDGHNRRLPSDRAGGYLMYFTARSVRSKIQCIGTATAGSPIGPFAATPHPLVCRPHHTTVDAIDPAAFTDTDGTHYLLYSSGALYPTVTPRTAIWLQRTSRNGQHVRGRPLRLIVADRADEAHIVEAPSLITAAASTCCSIPATPSTAAATSSTTPPRRRCAKSSPSARPSHSTRQTQRRLPESRWRRRATRTTRPLPRVPRGHQGLGPGAVHGRTALAPSRPPHARSRRPPLAPAADGRVTHAGWPG